MQYCPQAIQQAAAGSGSDKAIVVATSATSSKRVRILREVRMVKTSLSMKRNMQNRSRRRLAAQAQLAWSAVRLSDPGTVVHESSRGRGYIDIRIPGRGGTSGGLGVGCCQQASPRGLGL